MPILFQKNFTESEATAILDMITILVNDDYAVTIYLGRTKLDSDSLMRECWAVDIVETDLTTVATAENFLLVNALSDAYQQTPEGKNRNNDH
jgi:hypothetical protein